MKNKTTLIKSIDSPVAVAGTALVAASAAPLGDQDFTLVNKTGVEIHALHVAPHSSDEWGEDILGKDTLANGESLGITFGKHAAPITGICASKTRKETALPGRISI
jgi:hypothetical protein